MRSAILIALLIMVLALFAINASAILDGGSGLNVDQLIDASNGIYPKTGIPESPQASRKLWSEQRGIDSPCPESYQKAATVLRPLEVRCKQAKVLIIRQQIP